MSNIKIENPWLFLVAIPLIAIVFVGFFLLPKAKRTRPKNIISFALHLVMCATLACSFANIQYLHSSTSTEIYVLVDCSASEKDAVTSLDSTVKELVKQEKDANPNSKVGVLAFARSVHQVTALGGDFKTLADEFKDAETANSWNSVTNIAAALGEVHENYFSDECVKKIVLVSDGQETDGDAVSKIDELLKDDISIDAVNISATPEKEVAITGIEYTDNCYVGRNETVKVTVRSKKSTSINVKLNRSFNGGDAVTVNGTNGQNLTVGRGINVITFDKSTGIDTATKGSADFTVTIDAKDDDFEENNVMRFTQNYTDEFNVLFIGKTATDVNNFKTTSGYEDKTINVFSADSSDDIPYTLDEFVKYDEIVLSDININTLFGTTSDSAEKSKAFLTALNTAVNVYGKSLLTYGATSSNVTADNYMYAYNSMLPVQFASDEKKAVVLLIDRSGSMDTDSRISKAKKGAIACLDLLGENDYVSIISFSDDAKVHQALTSARNKTQIIAAINKIKSDGGTELGKGLKAAYNQLKSVNCEYKTVITLTDGEPFDTEASLKKTIKNYAAENIVFSFINISCKDGESLLKRLTNTGNGTYYYCKTASQIVDVMKSSISEEITNTVIEDTTSISVYTASDPSLVDINTNAFPELHGFNYCRIKAAATTVLTVQYKRVTQDSDGNDITGIAQVPLYAYWNYGKGKVSSFTASLTDENATGNFRSSNPGNAFMKNIVQQALPNRSNTTLLEMSYTNYGDCSKVSVTANDGDLNAKVKATITAPDGSKQDIDSLYYDGKNYSYDKVDTGVNGKYTVHVEFYSSSVLDQSTPTYTADFPMYYDYSSEYDVFSNTENKLLYNITKKASGQLYAADGIDVQKSTADIQYYSYVSTMFPLLLVSIILYLVDIFVRKSDFKAKKKVAQGI